MAGTKPVEKATKGLNALVDEFTSAVKELVNAGEETAVHLAVGGGRAISAIIDASGEVTKVTVETAGNVAGTIPSEMSNAGSKGALTANSSTGEVFYHLLECRNLGRTRIHSIGVDTHNNLLCNLRIN